MRWGIYIKPETRWNRSKTSKNGPQGFGQISGASSVLRKSVCCSGVRGIRLQHPKPVLFNKQKTFVVATRQPTAYFTASSPRRIRFGSTNAAFQKPRPPMIVRHLLEIAIRRNNRSGRAWLAVRTRQATTNVHPNQDAASDFATVRRGRSARASRPSRPFRSPSRAVRADGSVAPKRTTSATGCLPTKEGNAQMAGPAASGRQNRGRSFPGRSSPSNDETPNRSDADAYEARAAAVERGTERPRQRAEGGGRKSTAREAS